ncbi:MAG: enoyl-CoA hydratase-related protein [Actinomycetota bacterium]|nr:enoyl-CoA hydratase-related protein [Actinomycetota bacterium]
MSALVRLDVVAGIATVTLDSPGNRNALSRQLQAELAEHVQAALADDAVRVLVLTHTGPVFCSGMDLRESRGAGARAQGVSDLPLLLQTLQGADKPVIVRLAGAARAGGVALVAACDLAVAADTVTFAFPEVRLGLVPAVLSVALLPLLAPRAARELFLTGEVFDAGRAVRIGLLTAAVPPERLDTEVSRYTDMLVAGAPGALAATKRLLSTQPGPDVQAQYDAMAALSAEHFASAEGQEGLRAFAERRTPTWASDRRTAG